MATYEIEVLEKADEDMRLLGKYISGELQSPSGSNPKGYWITPYQYSNPISALALDTTTNSAEHMTQFILKKGTLLRKGFSRAGNSGQ